jgi:hypothetical protein
MAEENWLSGKCCTANEDGADTSALFEGSEGRRARRRFVGAVRQRG